MKHYISQHPWQIIEKGFHSEFQEISESIFSLGNGRFGGRGNFEENYSGKSLPGAYFAGVYYPDLTRVGWWKNGYPEYFAKVLNGVNWIGIRIKINGKKLDLAELPCTNFVRTLDMEHGILIRSFDKTQMHCKKHTVTTLFIQIIMNLESLKKSTMNTVKQASTITTIMIPKKESKAS